MGIDITPFTKKTRLKQDSDLHVVTEIYNVEFFVSLHVMPKGYSQFHIGSSYIIELEVYITTKL